MAQVTWVKCNGKSWCPFANVDVSNVSTMGVYMIWHAGNPGRVVYVGQGDVAARIKAHRNDPDITQYAKKGTLYVTWASVASQRDRDGIERFLANTWDPLVGVAHPDMMPVAVNSPWA